MPIKGVLSKARIPVKLWTDIHSVESSALTQLTNTANLPFVFKHVAAMPDVHVGKGATVGSVVATKDAVIPAAVGVDIGCGMMAVKTPLDHRVVQDHIKGIRKQIEEIIPLGPDKNAKLTREARRWEGWRSWEDLHKQDAKLYQRARHQLGSLGGGNHFIEICLDTGSCGTCNGSGVHQQQTPGLTKVCTNCNGSGITSPNVWIMLHSGSRNVGKTIAERHINDAKRLMRERFIHLEDPDLSYFVKSDMEYQGYLFDLQWCQDYAYQNRVEMMNRIMKILSSSLNNQDPIPRLMEVNCHHNYVAQENHFGENVLVTRKGAVRAREGDLGIIPGSMGAKSFIVRGKGNTNSFCSCSHGAGRKHSRSQARKLFSVGDLQRQTDGVECRKDRSILDEIPSAYKDIDEVMSNQEDLVEVVAQLKQIMCVKG